MRSAFADLDAWIDQLSLDPKLTASVVYSTHLPAEPASFLEPDPPLPDPLRLALARRGVERLWSHQVRGLEAARRGESVLVTTPTASGKSLVFQLPVLEEALAGGPGRALFLFPLKALGQDQKKKFAALARDAGLGPDVAGCEIYDGDTPRALRQKIRKHLPRVLITNPDMLHLGILGNLEGWTALLENLRWIVLDELHTYRGIFGSHFHHVLARFLRACRGEGSRPTLIASSATAANAGEFAQRLTGRPFTWIRESGAPREGRHFILLSPEVSSYTATLRLLIRCLKADLKTIVFTKARRITELLYSWLRGQEPELARKVASYRSGFLPEERRKIEARLFSGELAGVISTSALEMGIDVGGLDACILVGYPGSMMATWQRSGRVGRSGRESLTALVAMPDALDQYFLEHPQELLERPCEQLIVDPGNEPVTRVHLVCAAAERPLSRADDREYLEPLAPVVGGLLREGHLKESAGRGELFTPDSRPHRKVNLRGTGETSTILDATDGHTVGTVDGGRVLLEGHPGAVYLHAGRQYLVRELDLPGHKVWAQPLSLDFFTTPLTEKETEILEIFEQRQDGPLRCFLGRLEVTQQVVGYERKKIGTLELLGQHALDLPPTHFETVGLWWEVPREIEETVRLAREHFLGALHASEHAAISLIPLLALCDRGDIGGISYPLHPQVEKGAVFVYDGHAGGVGIAAGIYRDLPGLLDRVLSLLAGCPCEDGCPSCVQSPKCGNGNRPLDKAGAAHLLRLLLGREEVPPEARIAAEAPREAPEPSPRRPRLDRLSPPPGDDELELAEEELEDGPAPEGAPIPAEALADEPEEEEEEEEEKEEEMAGSAAAGSGPLAVAGPRAKRRARPSAELPRTALFDLETLRSAADVGGWGNAHRMGVAVGVVCLMEEGRFEVFREEGVRELIDLLRGATLVVGFNIRGFDYKVLSGYTGEDYNRILPTFDLLEDIQRRLGHRLKLDNLAAATLGAGKSADGLQSLEWVQQGRFDLIEDYCRRDVEILRDLYLHGRREGRVYYTQRQGRKIELPVEW